ncbi:hypothetical protein PFISCL1PPCAC_18788, partial [Pristionchus fissidentatus]
FVVHEGVRKRRHIDFCSNSDVDHLTFNTPQLGERYPQFGILCSESFVQQLPLFRLAQTIVSRCHKSVSSHGSSQCSFDLRYHLRVVFCCSVTMSCEDIVSIGGHSSHGRRETVSALVEIDGAE